MDRSIKKLCITLKTPYQEASIDTLRRWIPDLFSGWQLLKNFTPQSCRAAAASKAKRCLKLEEDT